MKRIILIFIILFASGCTAEYNLEIKNNSFKEDIKVVIAKDEMPNNPYPDEIESDNQINTLLENEYSALFSNDKAYYKKDIVEATDYIYVDLNYKYTASEFKNSNSLNLCFDKFEFYNASKSYYINATGVFYCLYNDSINVNIKTNNKVISNNADSVNGNVYTWNINHENLNNVNIKFEVSKGISRDQIITYVTIIISIVLVILGFLYLKKKNKENNKI